MPYNSDLAARIREQLATRKDVEEKAMFGGLCFMVNGSMACGVAGDELMVRLGRDVAAAHVDEPGARFCDFTGRVMKTILLVEPEGYADSGQLDAWVQRAVRVAEEGD